MKSYLHYGEIHKAPNSELLLQGLLPNNQAHFVKTSPFCPAFCNLMMLNPLAEKQEREAFKRGLFTPFSGA